MAEQARFRSEQDDAGEPLGPVIGRLANEMADLAAAVEALETDLAAGDENHVDAARMIRLQTLDLTIQRLRGLSDFLDALAIDVPHGVAVDMRKALRSMTLSDVQDRLSGSHTACAKPASTCGEIELF